MYVVLEMNRNTHLYNGRGGVSYTVQQRSDGDVAKLNRTYQSMFLLLDTSHLFFNAVLIDKLCSKIQNYLHHVAYCPVTMTHAHVGVSELFQ